MFFFNWRTFEIIIFIQRFKYLYAHNVLIGWGTEFLFSPPHHLLHASPSTNFQKSIFLRVKTRGEIRKIGRENKRKMGLEFLFNIADYRFKDCLSISKPFGKIFSCPIAVLIRKIGPLRMRHHTKYSATSVADTSNIVW